jgi:hypothetical protein
MKKASKDLVERLVEHWDELEQAMPAGEWNTLINELITLRARSRKAVSALEPTRAFEELEKICLAHDAVRSLGRPHVRTRGFGSGSRRGRQEGPEYVILLNRVFDLVDKKSPPADAKPPEPKPQPTRPREGA